VTDVVKVLDVAEANRTKDAFEPRGEKESTVKDGKEEPHKALEEEAPKEEAIIGDPTRNQQAIENAQEDDVMIPSEYDKDLREGGRRCGC
jgi:hypothetical protein